MIPSDITINPLSGYGDSSVDMSMEEYTGRKPLPTREVWVYDADDTTSDMVEIDQYPKEEFIALNDPLSFTMVALGGTVTVIGSSNSASIVPVNFSDQLQFSLEVNGVPQDTWSVDSPGIAGDIGATEQYDFSMTVTVPENRTLEKKTWTFAISNGSHITTAVITIVQDEGVMTYSDIEVSLSYPSVIPASGGSSSPVLSYRQTWGWNGNITNGGVLTSGADVVYSGDHTNASTGTVTLPSRGTVLGDRLTVVSGVTVSMNGKSTSVQSDVYQEKNIPVEFSIVSDFHYDTGLIPASGGSKSPVLEGYYNITFSSGSVLGNLQAVDAPEGTQIIDNYRSYSMTSAPGFTIDTGNGIVTAENRGNVLGTQRSCGNVTSTLNATLVVSVSYADEDTFIRSNSTTLDSPVSQEANTIEDYYEFALNLDWPTPLPASGGTSVPTGDRVAGAVLTSGAMPLLATLRDAGYITYTYHRTLTVTQAAEGMSVVNTDQIQASSRGTVVGNDRTIRFNCDDYYDGSILSEYGGGTVYYKFATLAASVTQSKNVPVSLTSQAGFNYPSGDIPASGGSKSPTTTGDITVHFSSGSTTTHSIVGDYNGYTITASSVWSMVASSGFSINTSNGTVTAANRGTTAGGRRLSGNVSRTLSWTLTIDSTYGGGTLNTSASHTETTPVAQAANTATYGAVTLNVTSPVTMAAGGQTYTISPTASQTVSFSSESSRAGSISFSYAQSSAVSGFSLSGSTVTAASNQSTSAKTYTVNVTATGEGSASAVKSVVFNQAAGTITYSDITLNVTYPVISASGGTSTPSISYSQTWGWNGATTGGGTITSGGTLSYSGTSVSTSNGSVTAGSKGTTASGITTVTTATVSVSLNGKTASKQVAVQQLANVVESEALTTYHIDSTVPDVPASGGTAAQPSASGTITNTWTSGATDTVAAEVVIQDKNNLFRKPEFTGKNLGTTVTQRTLIGTYLVSLRKSVSSKDLKSQDVPVYQEANVLTTTYSGVSVTITSVATIPASGGTVNSGSCTYSQTKTDSYTSGASNTTTITSGGQVSWGSVTAGSKGTTVSGVTSAGTITCTVTLNGKSGSASATVNQAANAITGFTLTPGYLTELSGAESNWTAPFVPQITIPVDATTPGATSTLVALPAVAYTPSYSSGTVGATYKPEDDLNGNGIEGISWSWNCTKPAVAWVRRFNSLQYGMAMLEIEENTIPTARQINARATVTLTLGSISKSQEYTWTISQEAGESYYLNVSPTSLSFIAGGESKNITIDTNESWTIS